MNEKLFNKNKENIINSFYTLKRSNDFYLDYLKEYDNIVNYSDFSKIPILTKDMLMRNYSSFFNAVKDKRLECYSTSGTSGKPLKIYRTVIDDMAQNSILNFYRMKHYPQIVSNRGIHFLFIYRDTIPNSLYEVNNYNNRFERFQYFVINDFLLNAALLYIDKYKPSWIVGSVSFVLKLAEYEIKHRLLNHKIEYIECNSEYLYDYVVTVVEEAFMVKPTSIYGSNEHGVIAFQCEKGNMHIVEENVFVEINEKNNVIITSLINKRTGLLRYEQGDIAKWSNKSCSCSLNGPVIELTGFRKNDFITYGDTSIDMWFFHGLVKKLQILFNIEIKQYKVIQENRNINIQLIVTNSEYFSQKKEMCLMIEQEFKKIFRNELVIHIYFVDQILNNSKTGKFKYFEKI